MAKRLLQTYQFVPAEDKIVLDGNIDKKRLLLITNMENNVILYNFADNTLGLVSYSFDSATETTTIVLQKDCNLMSSSDTLQIFYEGDGVHFEPDETFVDPVSKFRVSTPQNLIDTDFEYGPQSSKWETIQLINNVPSFYSSTSDTSISFINEVNTTQGSDIIQVVCGFDHGLLVGTPITVQGLSSVSAEGAYLVQSIPTSTTFTYKARANQPTTEDISGVYTSIIPGQFYQGSQILVDEAEGITADFFTVYVTVQSVQELTMTTSIPNSFTVGAVVANASNNATGIISKIDGSVLSVTDVVGTFNAGDVLNTTSTSDTITIDAGGVGGAANKQFLDGVQQDTFELSKRAIYVFDTSDSSNSTHIFNLSETADGIHTEITPGVFGVPYTTYVYSNGTAGSAGAYVQYDFAANSTPPEQIFYYDNGDAIYGGSDRLFTLSTNSTFTEFYVYDIEGTWTNSSDSFSTAGTTYTVTGQTSGPFGYVRSLSGTTLYVIKGVGSADFAGTDTFYDAPKDSTAQRSLVTVSSVDVATNALENENYIVVGATNSANNVDKITSLVVGPGERVVVNSTTQNNAFSLVGFEDLSTAFETRTFAQGAGGGEGG